MATKFSMVRDINGYNSFALPYSDTNYNMLLAANVAQTVTMPTDNAKYLVVFSFESGSNVWTAPNTTAVIPSGAAAAGVSQLNPTVRIMSSGDTLSLITNATTAHVGVSIYAI